MSNEGPNIPIKFDEIDPFGSQKMEFEDGTNIFAGTPYREEITTRVLPWYIPAQGKGSINWNENLAKLRSRFDNLIDQHCATECYLIQTLFPLHREVSDQPPGILPDRQRLYAGPGLHLDPARLFETDQPIAPRFPIMNVRGAPFANSDGKIAPFRLGLNRYISVYAIPDGLRPLPVPRLAELLDDGKNLIFQLPANIAAKIWRNWQKGFTQRNANLIWLDLLFELSWQREKDGPFHADRLAWYENTSVSLCGRGLFPRLPQFITSPPNEFCPHEYGYPLSFYSKIKDIPRASIAAIDEILEFDSQRPKNQRTNGPRKDLSAARTKVFISYSHKDKKFLDELLTHLKPIERSGQLSSWSDKQIDPGSKWFEGIQTALSQSKVVVLLVSANFLASNFINEHELTPSLTRAEANGVRILWIPVRACVYKHTPIQKYQAIISPDKPLAEMKANRDKAWVKVCEEIQQAAAK